jgi:hypothetical protein
MNKVNRALDGDQFENSFVKNLNKNKDHVYWKEMGLSENNNLHFVKVKGNKFSSLNKKKIKPKTDVYIFKQKISDRDLEKNEYYFEEGQKNFDFLNYLPGSGVSLKMNDAKSIQIDKCSVDKFEKRFNSKELFFGQTIYLDDLKRNHSVRKNSKVSWAQIAKYFSIGDFKNFDDNTNFNEEDKKLFSKIHNFSKSKIEEVLKNDINVLNSLFKGTDEFEDPFCATWLLIKSKLTKTIPDPNDISVTKGSSGGRDCPPVVFKL